MKRTITLCVFLLAFVFNEALAQERTITGKITASQDNEPIPGVAIVVVGTTIGTVTDVDGNYKLAIPASAMQLKFSGVGLKSKTLDVGDANTMDVVLDPDIMKVDEVVVTALAINREKRSLGYSTQQVSSEELTAGQNANFIGALEGKVSGVNITSLSGAPGSADRIVIRGGTSLTRNNQALMVVDGVPIDNSNFIPATPTGVTNELDNQVDYGNRGNDINPDDIESVSVLKGPAAAALYGSRASAGAIIITTKKGRRAVGGKGKMDVTFNSNVTFSSVLKLPDFQNTYGQGDVDNTPDDRRENFSWGLPFDGQLRPWGQEIDGKSRIKPYSALEDNVKDFFDVGVAYSNNISFGGGSEKSDYYLSIGALNANGVIPTSNYDKYSLRFNGSSELSNHFSTSISLNYTNISSTLPSGGQRDASVFNQLIQTPRDIPITEGKDLSNPFNAYSDVANTYGFYGAYTVNPYFVLENFKNTNNVDRLLGSAMVNYNYWKWLTISDRFGVDFYSDRRYQKWKKYDYAPIDPLYAGLNQTYQGKYSEDIYNLVEYNNDLMATLKHQLTPFLSGSLLLGQNIRQRTLTNTYGQTNDQGGLALAGYYNLENSNGGAAVRNNFNQTRLMGYYADLNLSYKTWLFVELTGRMDKSSTVPAHSTFFYPSANASFVFSEFFGSTLKDKWWTYGKLRASYAKVGNDAQAYVTTTTYSKTDIDGGFGNTTFPFGSVIGYSVGDQVGNPDIKPEFTTATEIGADLGFLNDRIIIDFAYYMTSTTDQIIPLPLSHATGYRFKIINAGEVQNKGFELGIKAVAFSNKNVKWEIYGTYTKNTNEVVSLYPGVDQIVIGGFSRMAIVAQEGKPYGSFYAIDLKHVDQNDLNSPVVVDSATGMPQTTTNPQYLGNYQPDYIASLGTTFTYKNFKFNILFDTKQGGKFYSRTKDIMDFVGTSEETVNRNDQVWPGSVYLAGDGQYKSNNTPYHPYDYYTNVIPDGRHIVDASYVKLRQASLTYDLPAKWLGKTPFGSASVSVFGNNLAIWTDEENQYSDPEQNSSGSGNAQGFEFSSNISQRNYGVDLKFTF